VPGILEITWFRLNRWLKYLQLNSANRDAGRRLQNKVWQL